MQHKMCNECRRTPCHPRCPNAVQKAVCECEQCGDDIYEGETMYKLGDMYFCEGCVNRGKKEAEFDDI